MSDNFDPATYKHDGVHTFKEMEAIALNWRRKFNECCTERDPASFAHFGLLDDVAKALGIQIGRESWWDNNPQAKREKILSKIKALRSNERNA